MLTFTQYLKKALKNFHDVKSSYAQMLYEAKLLAAAKKQYDKVREQSVLERLSMMTRLELYLQGKDVLLTTEKREFVCHYIFDSIKFDHYNDIDQIIKVLKKTPIDPMLESIPYPFEEFYTYMKSLSPAKEYIELAKKLSTLKKTSDLKRL